MLFVDIQPLDKQRYFIDKVFFVEKSTYETPQKNAKTGVNHKTKKATQRIAFFGNYKKLLVDYCTFLTPVFLSEVVT